MGNSPMNNYDMASTDPPWGDREIELLAATDEIQLFTEPKVLVRFVGLWGAGADVFVRPGEADGSTPISDEGGVLRDLGTFEHSGCRQFRKSGQDADGTVRSSGAAGGVIGGELTRDWMGLLAHLNDTLHGLAAAIQHLASGVGIAPLGQGGSSVLQGVADPKGLTSLGESDSGPDIRGQRLYTPEEAAALMRMHVQTVRKRCRQGQVGFQDGSRRWWITGKEVENYLLGRQRVHGR